MGFQVYSRMSRQTEKVRQRNLTGNFEDPFNRNSLEKLVIFSAVIIMAGLMILSSLTIISYGNISSSSPGAQFTVANTGTASPYFNNQLGAGNGSGVNPNQYYQSEPAPVGIADFGIGQNNSPYFYNTSAFEGNVHIIRLELNGTAGGTLPNAVDNGSGNIVVPIGEQLGNQLGMTMQLNVQFAFVNSGHLYDYWIQDVVTVTPNNATSAACVGFENNIWNFSSPNAGMNSNSVKGNGSVSTFLGTGVYAYCPGNSVKGNDISLNYPSNIDLRVLSRMNAAGPQVVFQYNDGLGWVTYDTPVFIFAKNVTTFYRYVVDGYQMNPLGLYWDAELTLGGLGDGLYTSSAPATNMFMTLKYWNGHNYQYIPNAFNFGSDTGESITYVTSTSHIVANNGTIGDQIYGGQKGTLHMSYNSTQYSTLSLETPVNSGTIQLGGTSYNFTGGKAIISAAPGIYTISILSKGSLVWQHTVNLIQGQIQNINASNYHKLTFSETGLPAGAEWNVTIGPETLSSTGQEITFFLPNGTYTYSISHFSKYSQSIMLGKVKLTRNTVIDVSYSLVSYRNFFKENGLPNNSEWYVNVSGFNSMKTDSPAMSISLPNGTYYFSTSTSNGNYLPNVSSGSFTVNGASVTVNIDFYSTYEHSTVFTETGLQANTQWGISMAGVTQTTNGNSVVYNELNGTYKYKVINPDGYVSNPSSGTVVISSTNTYTIQIQFSPSHQYTVTFNENGIPSGTTWSVDFNGITETSNSNAISFLAVNGTYGYTVQSTSGYHATPGSGSVTVQNKSTTVGVKFVQTTYSVTFSETGLPPGSQWTVTMNGVSKTSTNSTITFMEPNGTYKFTVYSIALYNSFEATPSSGQVIVNGSNASQSVVFTPNPSVAGTAAPSSGNAGPIGLFGSTVGIGGGSSSAVAIVGFRKRITDGIKRGVLPLLKKIFRI